MKTIKDSVHDHISVGGVARDLLDTPPVQRLRHIRQLGTAQLVYPSANHTRFEHSLGVFYLADRALAGLGIEGRQAERVRAAALLHDVGHGPFSHNTEWIIERHTGKAHDDVQALLRSDPIAGVLRSHNLEPGRVAALVAGDGRLGQLVSGELDVDRMDYLIRDAHHTGVPYGTIDVERLVRELTFYDDELVLAEGNVQTAESLLLARALMNPTVYNHHVARIGKSMLRRATEAWLGASDVDATESGLSADDRPDSAWPSNTTRPTGERLRRMDDAELLVALRQSPASSSLANRLSTRNLYKRAVWAELSDVPKAVTNMDRQSIHETEVAIADRAGVDPVAVIIDCPSIPPMRESTSRVVVNGEIRRLGRQSPLVDALRQAQRNQWRLGVYGPREQTDAIGMAAVEELDLDIEGSLLNERGTTVPTTFQAFE